VFDLIERHGIVCDALQSGWIQPAHSANAFEKVKSRAGQWAERGRPAEVLSRALVAGLTGAPDYVGGWIDRSGGVLNPVEYARGLADAAERAGAQIFEGTRVTAINRSGGGWILRTRSGVVRAGKVIVATNAYGGPLLPTLRRTYFPLKVFQIATNPLPRDVRKRLLPGGQCVSDTRRNLFTFRFDAANRLISGGMHVLGPGADDRVPEVIHRRLARHLDLRDLPRLEFAWSGLAAVQPDFLPHLVDMGPGLIAAFACNGRGIAVTTAMGRVLADWAGGAEPRDLAIPFAPASPIPFHDLLQHAPNMLLPWSMLRDRLDVA
jgi:glycine/D-amino acid oxidase-like deaminating enzyme